MSGLISTSPLTVADMPWVWNVYQATVRQQNDVVLDLDDDGHHVRRRAELAERWFEAIEVSGRRVGLLEVRPDGDVLDLRHLELLPEHQGAGIGTAVIRMVIDRARRAGKDVSLRVLHVNPRARALYESLGFVVEQERARSTQLRFSARG